MTPQRFEHPFTVNRPPGVNAHLTSAPILGIPTLRSRVNPFAELRFSCGGRSRQSWRGGPAATLRRLEQFTSFGNAPGIDRMLPFLEHQLSGARKVDSLALLNRTLRRLEQFANLRNAPGLEAPAHIHPELADSQSFHSLAVQDLTPRRLDRWTNLSNAPGIDAPSPIEGESASSESFRSSALQARTKPNQVVSP